jgi:tetratricopeptide (TPR) repeat protein
MRGTRDQAIQVLSDALAVSGRMPEAMAVLDYASRWYARAEQWLAYAAVAQGAMDSTRTAKAYRLAFQLDPARFDARMLDTFAGVLDQVGDYATYERIAHELVRVAGEDKTWLACGLNHIACALIGQDKFDEALPFAVRATVENPVAVNAPVYTATVERARTHSKEMAQPVATAIEGRQRDPIYGLLEAGDHVAAAERLRDPSWRVRGAALHATRFRLASENHVEVTPRARAAAVATLADTIGAMDRDAVLVRALALQIREQAYFPRDPAPRLGDRMTREAFYQEFRARGGVVLGEQSPPPAEFSDRVVVAGSKVARASDYIALLRDLAALAPREALAQFDLDDAGYLEVARAWTAAMEADPSIARTIEAGLAAKN